MNTQHHELWTRLEHYTPDEEGAFPYSARLARENDWPSDYVRRVICEYKRFAFLAVVAGHPVTPSDQVDQAWHLHLLYTKSYWDGFCGKILGRPLHHEPTRGGAAERGKFEDWYERTRQSYREWFGEAPPDDIWPDARRRFGDDVQFVRVNVARHWVVPKLGKSAMPVVAMGRWMAGVARAVRCRGHRMGLAFAIVAVGALLLAGCREFARADGPGGDDAVGDGIPWWGFVWAWSVLQGGAWFVRRRLCAGDPVPEGPVERVEESELGRIAPSEVAYLAGGPRRVVDAALAALATGESLRFDSETGKAFPSGPLPPGLGPIEGAIHEWVSAASTSGIGLAEIRRQSAPLIAEVEKVLMRRGWVLSSGRRASAVGVPLTMAMLAPAFGAFMAVSGMTRGATHVGLWVLCGISALTALLGFGRRVGRTRRGDEALERLRKWHEPLRSWGTPTPPEAGWGMAVGLFGLSALDGGPWAGVATALRPRDDSRPGGCGGGGGCGGWVGGGDAGCGADGGSGCGAGCGGGGCGGGCGGCGG